MEVELRTVAGDGSSSFVRSSSFSVAADHSIEDATCDRSRIASLARCGTGAAPAAAASARSSLTRRLALCCPRCSLLDLYIGRSSGRAGVGERAPTRAARRGRCRQRSRLGAQRWPSPEQRRAQRCSVLRCSVLLCAAQLAPLSLAALSLARSGEGVREPLVDL